jgi:hypothetical protein
LLKKVLGNWTNKKKYKKIPLENDKFYYKWSKMVQKGAKKGNSVRIRGPGMEYAERGMTSTNDLLIQGGITIKEATFKFFNRNFKQIASPIIV